MADKGYHSSEDMIACLENGIIPHVITDDGKDGYELELSYEVVEKVDTTSSNPEEKKKPKVRNKKIKVVQLFLRPNREKMAQMNLAIHGIETDLGKNHADTFFHDLHPQELIELARKDLVEEED